MEIKNIVSDLFNVKAFNIRLDEYNNNLNKQKNTIGELQEKNIHHAIKNLISTPDEQEVKIGSYYADCFKNNTIFEIQTRQFNKLRDKLTYFLSKYHVHIIYPIIYKRELVWINNNGEVSYGKKTTNNSKFNSVFPELYKIKDLLKNENISLTLMLINVREYRRVTGFTKLEKKKSQKLDKDLLEIVDCLNICSTLDYYNFVNEISDVLFTTRNYKKVNNTKIKEATIALNVLYYLDIVERIGKKDRMYLYKVKK